MAWLDEKAHGEERAYKARQLALQERNDLKTSISLGFALVALIISGLALYRSSWPQNTSTPPGGLVFDDADAVSHHGLVAQTVRAGRFPRHLGTQSQIIGGP